MHKQTAILEGDFLFHTQGCQINGEANFIDLYANLHGFFCEFFLEHVQIEIGDDLLTEDTLSEDK